jgi:uncharacterized protein (DUF2147 family)
MLKFYIGVTVFVLATALSIAAYAKVAKKGGAPHPPPRALAFVIKWIQVCAAICLGFAWNVAFAADLKDMIGRWRWQQFTIEVTACQGDSICAKIIEGPKNVGMEVFATQLTVKDSKLFGQITHPETRDIYNTRFQQDDGDKWRLDGCTVARVCLSGEFVRVK